MADSPVKILKAPSQSELVIQRSRFLALVFPIENAGEAREHLKTLKALHPDSSHVVHAFQVGLERSLTGGCSDDGEPPGTAGRPVYDVLKGFDCTNVFLAVVRYFGGIKLGTGGLVKAYGDAAKLVLQEASWSLYRAMHSYELKLEYQEHRPLMSLVEELGGELERESFSECVECQIKLPLEACSEFEKRITDLTRGRLVF